MLTIGLTGSIGSGKSTVRELLEKKGAYVIDADKVGHELYHPGSPTWNSVVSVWGESVLQGDLEIDRKKLGSIVFADPNELRKLNEIMHPAIREEVVRRRELLKQEGNNSVLIVEAAALIEAGWQDLVDEVWLVKADDAVISQRLQEGRGLTPEAISIRLSRQMPVSDKEAQAHVIIENNGDLKATEAGIDNLWAERFGSFGIESR